MQAINTGVKNMPPYNWILSDGEAERLVKYMEENEVSYKLAQVPTEGGNVFKGESKIQFL